MKTFLNVVGVLALLGSVLAFIASKSAVHEILAAIGLLIACTCVGVAKILEYQKEGAAQLAQILTAVTANVHAVNALSGPSTASPDKLPPVPGKEVYYVSDGERGIGPYSAEKLKALLEKGTIARDAYILMKGSQEWVKLNSVIQV